MTEPSQSGTTGQAEALANLFRHASRMMARGSHRSHQAPHAQQRVLAILRERGPLTQAELLQLLDVRSSSLSELIGKLVHSGAIIRRRNENDKRGYILSLNENGGDGNRVVPETGPMFEANPFSCLDSQEQQQLQTLLVKIIDHLGQNRRGQGGRGRGRRHYLRNQVDREDTAKGKRHSRFGHSVRGRGRQKGNNSTDGDEEI
nr:MarR family transcriptional regulator [uncultured Desulfobulbus sp.]